MEVELVRSFELPTRLVHGQGAVQQLGELAVELGVERPLVVTDAGLVAAGHLEPVLEILKAAGTTPTLFDGVVPNPGLAVVAAGTAAYRANACDGLIGFGGGSSIDTAKAVGVEVVHDGAIADFEYGRIPLTRRIPTLIAVPTTAGTGSEVTLWAVITDPKRKYKFNVGGTPLIAPHVAVIDPMLAVGLPAGVTAGTGMDALAHAIECYTGGWHQPATDAVALLGIEYGMEWLRTAYHEPTNLEARYMMAMSAMLGGASYGTESAGAAHAMSQSSGALHDAPHGALTARLLGPVMAFNISGEPGRYARVAKAMGEDVAGLAPLEAAERSVEAIDRLTWDLSIPTLSELGFEADNIKELAQLAYEDPQTIGNPRELDVGDYVEIWADAFSRPRGN